ncbi:MAG TPA: hypothetical protein PL033_05645 [Candidatus Brocadiia bacterium]|nr:hypothetical protein [Candidatus Brocadiia bacterium]
MIFKRPHNKFFRNVSGDQYAASKLVFERRVWRGTHGSSGSGTIFALANVICRLCDFGGDFGGKRPVIAAQVDFQEAQQIEAAQAGIAQRNPQESQRTSGKTGGKWDGAERLIQINQPDQGRPVRRRLNENVSSVQIIMAVTAVMHMGESTRKKGDQADSLKT